ncbi:MAG: helix-turn-helix transcriptional regulator [Clostridia bacterium]|nr:helix-turn-helix transcriptional regulator [Clostridia bacterium]
MIFKKTFNIGMSEYINTIRIQHSCTLMNQGFTSISDISNQCGYSDPQYFSKVFKKRMGMLPGEYIKSIEM